MSRLDWSVSLHEASQLAHGGGRKIITRTSNLNQDNRGGTSLLI